MQLWSKTKEMRSVLVKLLVLNQCLNGLDIRINWTYKGNFFPDIYYLLITIKPITFTYVFDIRFFWQWTLNMYAIIWNQLQWISLEFKTDTLRENVCHRENQKSSKWVRLLTSRSSTIGFDEKVRYSCYCCIWWNVRLPKDLFFFSVKGKVFICRHRGPSVRG